eukprot:366229-Chlamydomonas_euryale.AAC.31
MPRTTLDLCLPRGVDRARRKRAAVPAACPSSSPPFPPSPSKAHTHHCPRRPSTVCPALGTLRITRGHLPSDKTSSVDPLQAHRLKFGRGELRLTTAFAPAPHSTRAGSLQVCMPSGRSRGVAPKPLWSGLSPRPNRAPVHFPFVPSRFS